MRSREWVVAACLCAAACKRNETPAEPDPVATKPAPQPSPSHAADASPPISDALQIAIAQADENAPTSCKKADRVLLAGAAALHFTCDAWMHHIALVAPGATQTFDEHDLVIEPSVHGFWTPLGVDRKFVALRSWECAPPTGCDGETRLYELVGDRFASKPLVFPWALPPGAQTDVDDDGFPDLVVPYLSEELQGPPPKGCSETELASIEFPHESVQLTVDFVTSWNEKTKTFVWNLASFQPWYAMRLSAARSLAKHLAAAPAPSCPMETLRTAAEIEAYGRVLGEPDASLDAEADAIASRTTEWKDVRHEFTLPGFVLDAKR